jgi:hypothetical protein
MLSRCRNPRSKLWKNYGGRGITVCERWHTYEHFLTDMGRRPDPQHSLDRIDNEKGYSPENCRWATATQQRRNTRRVKNLITVDGETRLLGEWLKEKHLPLHVFYRRIADGASVENALRQPYKHSAS